MAGNQQVDRAEMAKAAQQIEAKHQALHGVQQTLMGQMETLSGGWSGNAATAFMQAHDAVNKQIDRVQAGLETIHGKLVDSQMRYSRNEEEQAAAANPILGMIG